ncbi:OmpA family protein [Leptospira bourretii]|uniref:OmpA family protein n=1 Tax=Leptospira bourretii TaxID=2484962 RepID=A0A4R9IK02_9LEPT|nr:OmpA family protein [Leptospira bourretii]TGK79572.1 OmpA family protein [Leptospira bourretii]TGK89780.1 OmpA family protein [Leptospira bourretii]TGL19457.1 OmpA family protein [Leptospira bourretii]TGL42956.1 OmpA family protein [Leptospira bourretii]
MKQIISGLLSLSLLSTISCGLSDNTKRLILSTSIGCGVGLALGAVYDETQRKKDSKDKKNDIQRQIKSSLAMEKKKPQNKGKIVGLGAGCLAGLGTGFYLNTMYDNMAEEMKKQGITLTKSERGGETVALTATMDGGIAFEDGKADLKGKGKENIDKLAEALAAYPETKVNISGHANKTGSEDLNLSLSKDRAVTAKNALTSNGVESKRIGNIEGLGSSSPLKGVDPKDGSNRRVEVEIVPAS